MECPKCHTKNQTGKFCTECGCKLENAQADVAEGEVVGAPIAQPAATSKYATASLVCSIVGICLFWMPFFGLALTATGLGLGIASGKDNAGRRPAGLVVGAVGLGLSILALIFYIIMTIISLSGAMDLLDQYADPNTWTNWDGGSWFFESPSQI